MVKQNEMEDLKAKSANKIDPDPFSLLLMILAALGSAASLLSYADSKREEVDRREKRSRHRILDSITIAKNTMNSLRAKVELIEVVVRSEGSLNSRKAHGAKALGFGSNSLVLDEAGLNRWRSIQNDIHSELGILLNCVLSLSLFFASSDYKLSIHVESEFRSAVRMLNDLLRSLSDIDLDGMSMRLLAAINKMESAFKLLEENVGALSH